MLDGITISRYGQHVCDIIAGTDSFLSSHSIASEAADDAIKEDGGPSKKPRLSQSSHTPSSRVSEWAYHVWTSLCVCRFP